MSCYIIWKASVIVFTDFSFLKNELCTLQQLKKWETSGHTTWQMVMKQQKKWGAAYSWNNSGTITANSRSSVLKNAMEWKKHKPPNFNKILTKKQNSSNSWSNFWRWDFQIQKGQHSHWNERGGLKWWPVAKLQICNWINGIYDVHHTQLLTNIVKQTRLKEHFGSRWLADDVTVASLFQRTNVSESFRNSSFASVSWWEWSNCNYPVNAIICHTSGL